MSHNGDIPDGGPPADIEVRFVDSDSDLEAAFAVRTRVFHEEQQIPLEEEFDEDDETATHVIAFSAGEPVGTGRLLLHDEYAQIGRMAVDASYRRQGIGEAIVHALIQRAREKGYDRFLLHAQVQALPFYQQLGFVVVGPEFDEAGIPHRRMQLVVN